MAEVRLPVSGGCHCGEVRYQLKDAPLWVNACHCTNCQKISGSAFGLSMVIPAAALEMTSGELGMVEWVADSGTVRQGHFCRQCGTRMYHGQDGVPFYSLRAGTLDNRSWVVPSAHIWTAEAQPWFPFAETDITDPGQPEDNGPIMQRFRDTVTFVKD